MSTERSPRTVGCVADWRCTWTRTRHDPLDGHMQSTCDSRSRCGDGGDGVPHAVMCGCWVRVLVCVSATEFKIGGGDSV